ncbi:hypothetical protein [Bacillus sp. OV166]|uniref:hypothetical protein n=1 Tax=Bacillus sp. OV166 TaxID=1882763 RepID=UPI000B42FE57|nr:hypothetical protein [Bacillus sp. OV166]
MDVQDTAQLEINISGMLKFADFFFDGFNADYPGGNPAFVGTSKKSLCESKVLMVFNEVIADHKNRPHGFSRTVLRASNLEITLKR